MWGAENYLAWQVYLAAATQFNHDFTVDVFALMDLFGVKNKRRMLTKLAVIYDCAQKNSKQ